MGKGKHLIVLDIDLEGDKWRHLADRLLKVFKGYFVVNTPSGGYHIYVKVEGVDKFKSGYLYTSGGDKTTIEILGEGKKVMGPGNIVDMDKMYKPDNKWENSLSTSFIDNEELISKLKEVGLMITSKYIERESEGSIRVKEKGRNLINILVKCKKEGKSVRFDSLVHGSCSGGDTILFTNGKIYCYKCKVTCEFREYVVYCQIHPLNIANKCGDVIGYGHKNLTNPVAA